MGLADEKTLREARDDIARDRADHERRAGREPNTRQIERWATEVVRRNDRRISERGNTRTRGR